MKVNVRVGDEIEWKGRPRKVVKLVSIFDGVDETICLPVDATRVELPEQRKGPGTPRPQWQKAPPV